MNAPDSKTTRPETLVDIEVEEKVGRLPTFYSVYVLGEDVGAGVG